MNASIVRLKIGMQKRQTGVVRMLVMIRNRLIAMRLKRACFIGSGVFIYFVPVTCGAPRRNFASDEMQQVRVRK
jgi:hypothetical protein